MQPGRRWPDGLRPAGPAGTAGGPAALGQFRRLGPSPGQHWPSSPVAHRTQAPAQAGRAEAVLGPDGALSLGSAPGVGLPPLWLCRRLPGPPGLAPPHVAPPLPAPSAQNCGRSAGGAAPRPAPRCLASPVRSSLPRRATGISAPLADPPLCCGAARLRTPRPRCCRAWSPCLGGDQRCLSLGPLAPLLACRATCTHLDFLPFPGAPWSFKATSSGECPSRGRGNRDAQRL